MMDARRDKAGRCYAAVSSTGRIEDAIMLVASRASVAYRSVAAAEKALGRWSRRLSKDGRGYLWMQSESNALAQRDYTRLRTVSI